MATHDHIPELPPDGFMVNVVTTVSPSLFWLDPLNSQKDIFQSGLHCLIPLDVKVNIFPEEEFYMCNGDAWTIGSSELLVQAVANKQTYFVPMVKNDSCAVFKKKYPSCVFGELYVIVNSKISSISDLLMLRGMARRTNVFNPTKYIQQPMDNILKTVKQDIIQYNYRKMSKPDKQIHPETGRGEYPDGCDDERKAYEKELQMNLEVLKESLLEKLNNGEINREEMENILMTKKKLFATFIKESEESKFAPQSHRINHSKISTCGEEDLKVISIDKKLSTCAVQPPKKDSIKLISPAGLDFNRAMQSKMLPKNMSAKNKKYQYHQHHQNKQYNYGDKSNLTVSEYKTGPYNINKTGNAYVQKNKSSVGYNTEGKNVQNVKRNETVKEHQNIGVVENIEPVDDERYSLRKGKNVACAESKNVGASNWMEKIFALKARNSEMASIKNESCEAEKKVDCFKNELHSRQENCIEPNTRNKEHTGVNKNQVVHDNSSPHTNVEYPIAVTEPSQKKESFRTETSVQSQEHVMCKDSQEDVTSINRHQSCSTNIKKELVHPSQKTKFFTPKWNNNDCNNVQFPNRRQPINAYVNQEQNKSYRTMSDHTVQDQWKSAEFNKYQCPNTEVQCQENGRQVVDKYVDESIQHRNQHQDQEMNRNIHENEFTRINMPYNVTMHNNFKNNMGFNQHRNTEMWHQGNTHRMNMPYRYPNEDTQFMNRNQHHGFKMNHNIHGDTFSEINMHNAKFNQDNYQSYHRKRFDGVIEEKKWNQHQGPRMNHHFYGNTSQGNDNRFYGMHFDRSKTNNNMSSKIKPSNDSNDNIGCKKKTNFDHKKHNDTYREKFIKKETERSELISESNVDNRETHVDVADTAFIKKDCSDPKKSCDRKNYKVEPDLQIKPKCHENMSNNVSQHISVPKSLNMLIADEKLSGQLKCASLLSSTKNVVKYEGSVLKNSNSDLRKRSDESSGMNEDSMCTSDIDPNLVEESEVLSSPEHGINLFNIVGGVKTLLPELKVNTNEIVRRVKKKSTNFNISKPESDLSQSVDKGNDETCESMEVEFRESTFGTQDREDPSQTDCITLKPDERSKDLIDSTQELDTKIDNFPELPSFKDSFNVKLDNEIIDGIITPKLMVHLRIHEKITPWLRMNDTIFPKIIHSNLLFMNVREPLRVQTLLWPTIMRGQGALVVGPAASGKTIGLLAPLCSFLADSSLSDSFKPTHGPLAIIVCSSMKAVHYAYDICKNLLRNAKANGKYMKIVYLSNKATKEDLPLLFKGCDILIAMPTILSIYSAYQIKVLDLKRVSFLVLDEADILYDKFEEETQNIFLLCQNAQKKRVTSGLSLQVLAAARQWHCLFKDLALQSHRSVVCIGSHQECVPYSNADLRVQIILNDNKIKKVLDNIQQELKSSWKMVIICNEKVEVDELYENLNKKTLNVMKADDQMRINEIFQVKASWKMFSMEKNPILICCDENLQYLDILDANRLIHYSLPLSLSNFHLRFSTLTEKYSNIFQPVSENCSVKIDIFINEDAAVQLPKILEFISRCRVVVPDELLTLGKAILIDKERSKARMHVPICKEIEAFGKCSQFMGCADRHVFSQRDRPRNWVPRSGTVLFKALKVFSTGLLSIRLLEHISVEGIPTPVEQTYFSLRMQMATYFSNERNIRSFVDPKPGDICAVMLQPQSYESCCIVKVIDQSNFNNYSVLINILEEQEHIIADSNKLFYLPDHLQKIITPVVRARIAGIKPLEGESVWSESSKDVVKNILFTPGCDIIIRATVLLAVGTTLWLDNIQCCQKLNMAKALVVRDSIKQCLIKGDYVLENPDHMKCLYDICSDSGYELPEYSSQPKKCNVIMTKQPFPEPQWAHMTENEFHSVYFSSIVSFELFYIRNITFQSILNEMTNDIQKYVAIKQKDWSSEDADLTYQNKFYCIAKYSEDCLFHRAQIINIGESISDGNIQLSIMCFFVDHGESSSVAREDIYPITKEFITRLPFQAIECRLLGLKPTEIAWPESTADFLYDLCLENNTNFLKSLYARYCVKEKAEFTNGNKYGIILFDPEAIDKCLNNIFIKQNMAVPILQEVSLFENAIQDFDSQFNDSLDSEFDVIGNVGKVPDFILRGERPPSSNSSFSVLSDIDNKPENTEVGNQNAKTCDVVAELSDDGWDCQIDANSINDVIQLMTGETRFSASKSTSAMPRKTNSLQIQEITEEVEPIIDWSDIADYQTNVPAAPVDKIPLLLWYQTKSMVIIKIQVVGAVDYVLDIKSKSMEFHANIGKEVYKFSLDLYGYIKENSSKHVLKGRLIYVKLKKLINMDWMSLHAEDKKCSWIVYDFDFLEGMDSNDEDDCEIKQEIEERVRKMQMEDHDGATEDKNLEELSYEFFSNECEE